MENNIDSSLTDKELIEKAYWWIDELIKSGGKDFVMHIPARLDHDTDLVFFNVTKRLENILKEHATLQAKCDKYEAALKVITEVHAYPNVIARKALSAEEGETVPPKQDQPDLGNCQRCGITKASTQYSDLYVCDHCDKMLNNEFDEEYR